MNITTDELGFSIGITHADQLADRTRHDGETEIGVRHFATAELKAELHFIAVAEEFFGVADFGEEIAVGDTRAKFDFLDLVFFCSSYTYLPKSMIRQTGGVALGATSTRSRPTSKAKEMALVVSRMPSCLPSGEIQRTEGTLIR